MTNCSRAGGCAWLNYPFLTSKERDIETGLDYFGARYYASTQGRFTSTDPKPVTKESFLNPQRWNLYVYVNNNPLSAVDPNGADGKGKGGDKVISVFMDYGVKQLGRQITTDKRTGKKMSDVPNRSDWQGTKATQTLYSTLDMGAAIQEGCPFNSKGYRWAQLITRQLEPGRRLQPR